MLVLFLKHNFLSQHVLISSALSHAVIYWFTLFVLVPNAVRFWAAAHNDHQKGRDYPGWII